MTVAPPAPLRELDIRQAPNRAPLWWVLIGGAVILLAAGTGMFLLTIEPEGRVETHGPTPQLPHEARPLSEIEKLCRRFAELRNAGDAAADELLGVVPAVPAGAISEEEAERLQADFFLREPIQILQVRPERGGSSRCVFVTKGNVSAPALDVRTDKGVERSQRTMTHPDIVVEVRDGKIYGLRPQLHVGR